MSAPPRTRIIDRGLFGKTLECSNYVDSEDISLPPLNEETKVNDEDDDKQSINESRKQDVFLLSSRGSTFTIRRKAKAIRIEKCSQCTIRVPRGTVASIEILLIPLSISGALQNPIYRKLTLRISEGPQHRP